MPKCEKNNNKSNQIWISKEANRKPTRSRPISSTSHSLCLNKTFDTPAAAATPSSSHRTAPRKRMQKRKWGKKYHTDQTLKCVKICLSVANWRNKEQRKNNRSINWTTAYDDVDCFAEDAPAITQYINRNFDRNYFPWQFFFPLLVVFLACFGSPYELMWSTSQLNTLL